MRDYKDMEQVDLKLHLLSGDSISTDDLILKPYTLREVRDYGYSNYMLNLQWLTITVDDFIKSVKDIDKRMQLQVEKSKLKTFDFYTQFGEQEMVYGLLIALSMIFRTDDVRMLSSGEIAIDSIKDGILIEDGEQLIVNEDRLEELGAISLKLVTRDNFDDLVEAIKIQNYLTKPTVKKSREYNPADEETRKLLEQMKKNEEKVQKAKMRDNEDEDDEIDINDIISAVTAKSNSINKLNVWELTIYQLYDEYARLELIDNYDFSIKAMIAGAEKIELKHWSSRL